MFRLTLLFCLITSILFAQQSDEIVGKVKSVSEKIIYLEKKDRDAFLGNSNHEGEYGHGGFVNPKLSKRNMNTSWYYYPELAFVNFTAKYNYKGKITEETWFKKDNTFERKYEYNESDSLTSIKMYYDNKKTESQETIITHKNENTTAVSFDIYGKKLSRFNYYIQNYDKNKNLIKIQNFGEDGLINITFFKYNLNNKKTCEMIQIPYLLEEQNGNTKKITDSIGTIFYKFKYKYDEKNLLIDEQKYSNPLSTNSINKLLYQFQYKYDSNNNVIEKNQIDHNKMYSIKYEYDLLNRLISYKPNYDNEFEREYFYENNVISKVIIKKNDLTMVLTFAYKFDKKGNWIQQTKSVDGKPLYIWKRKIEYYNE